jgi:transcriptional regulator with XRE-family HTH domain
VGWGLPGEQGFKANPVDAEVGYNGSNARTMRSKLGFSQGQIAEQLGLTLAEYQECESGMRHALFLFVAGMIIAQWLFSALVKPLETPGAIYSPAHDRAR